MSTFQKINLGVSRAYTNTAILNNDLTMVKQCYSERDCCAFINRLDEDDIIFIAIRSKNKRHKTLIKEYKPYVDSILDRLDLKYDVYENVDMTDINEELKVKGDYVYSFKSRKSSYLDLFYFTIIRFLNDLKIEILNYCRELEALGFDVLQSLAYGCLLHRVLDDNFDVTFSFVNTYFYDFKKREEFMIIDPSYNIAGPQEYAYKYNFWSGVFYNHFCNLIRNKKETETFMDVYKKYQEFLNAKSISFITSTKKTIKVELSDVISKIEMKTIKSIEPTIYANLFKTDSERITISHIIKSYE